MIYSSDVECVIPWENVEALLHTVGLLAWAPPPAETILGQTKRERNKTRKLSRTPNILNIYYIYIYIYSQCPCLPLLSCHTTQLSLPQVVGTIFDQDQKKKIVKLRDRHFPQNRCSQADAINNNMASVRPRRAKQSGVKGSCFKIGPQIVNFFFPHRLRHLLLRGAIVNRTYGTHKNLYISLFFTHNIWYYLLWSTVNTRTPGIYTESVQVYAINYPLRTSDYKKMTNTYKKRRPQQ